MTRTVLDSKHVAKDRNAAIAHWKSNWQDAVFRTLS